MILRTMLLHDHSVAMTTIDDMQGMVNNFWDDEDCDAPSSATRRLKLLTILRKNYRPNEDDFQSAKRRIIGVVFVKLAT